MSPAREPTPAETRLRIAEAAAPLVREFDGIFGGETVHRFLEDAERRFEGAHVALYLPALVVRYARETLRAAASARGLVPKERPEVLFVCVQNAGRSQMAAALLRRMAGDRVVVRSAGSAPAGEIHGNVVEALREIGLDAAEDFPKPLADDFVRAADVVVTMGCGDACPVFPGKRYEDWKVADPAGKDLAGVRAVLGEIRGRVTALLRSLGIEPDRAPEP